MSVQEEIRAQLTGPGGPFELVEESVLGETMQVFKNRESSLRELLANSAAHGDKLYMVYGDRRITYTEHLRLVASVARALSEKYGIGPGDRVAILAANRPEWVITFWATVSLGGIVSAWNGLWTPDEIEHALALSEPKLIVGDRRRIARMEGLAHDVPVITMEDDFAELEAWAPDAPLPDVPIEEDAPCLILFTSGTTGRPKGAVVSHRAIVGFVKTQTYHGLERMMVGMKLHPPEAGSTPPPVDLCAMVTTPLFHLSGLYAIAVMMLVQGAKTVYREGRFDPVDVMRLIEKEKVSMWSALGAAAPQVLAHPDFGKYDLSSLRNIGFGGAPTSPALLERLKKEIPHAGGGLGMGYGLSESGGMGAAIGGFELDARPTSTGRAQLAHQIEIRDDEGKPLPTGVDGRIFMRSPYLMLEYWRNPDATAETILPGRWLDTGDVGRLDEEGYLYINSRARDMILRSGENVYPVEIEHRLHAHPQVVECAVVGEDHPDLGQEVKAIVVPEPGTSPTEAELGAWVGETLAKYKVPTIWEMRSDPLPRNAAGKVLKKVLTGEAEAGLIDE